MKRQILKVISGGQTGADEAGLIAAKLVGIPTGGCAPKGFKTEKGSNSNLGITFGLYESASSDYPERTKENVSKSDCTIIFTKDSSPGSVLTKNTCKLRKKPYLWIDPLSPEVESSVTDFLNEVIKLKNGPIIVNIAGNRESKYPGIGKKIVSILTEVFKKP